MIFYSHTDVTCNGPMITNLDTSCRHCLQCL